MFSAVAPSTHHIVVCGQTGVGKSWLCNNLLRNGETNFEESDEPTSCTKKISWKAAFSGDTVSDVPGYFDSNNNDQANQAAFIDHLKTKSLRAILFVYNNRCDSFIESAIKAFKASGLGNNVILVFNKRLKKPIAEEETYNGCCQINVMANQPNLNVLKARIASMQPIVASHLIAPFSLFRQPLEICHERIVDEFLEHRQLNVKVELSHDEIQYALVTHREGQLGPYLGDLLGLNEYITERVPCGKITVTEEHMVEKTHEVYQKYKYSYATRFDGVVDLCSREILPGQESVVRLD